MIENKMDLGLDLRNNYFKYYNNRIESRNSRLKVLFLTSWYPNKDHLMSGIFIKRHAQAVSKHCDVCVLYIHGSKHRKKASVESSVEDNIKTIRVYYKKSSFTKRTVKDVCNHSLNCIRGLETVRKEFGKPDIIHANVILPAGLIALFVNIFTGIPYVLTEHTSPFHVYCPNNFYKNLCRIILHRAKVVMPVSNSLENQIRRIYQQNKYAVIPNVIDTKSFVPDTNRKVPGSIKKMLHVSLLNDEQKNVSGMINAVNDLSNLRKDFELHIVGDGLDRKKLETLAANLKILDKFIFFHGRLEDAELQKLMRNSDFFVLNSTHETFAIVCAEALSSGIPVISTICGGPEEYIDDNMGILIEPKNHKDLVNAMCYMLDSAVKYEPDKLHEYIDEKFSYDAVSLKIYNIYKSL
jgi:glycosyltransferase involved in cell wall biosynthesis